jgi:YidC/Oxa1 family membrane protein insertase
MHALLHPVAFLSTVVAHLSAVLAPVGGAVAVIVLVTALVRLVLHPLTRAAVRGERARARLAPRVAELRRKHHDITRLGDELAKLYRAERISPFAGMVPLLAQIPVFVVLYRAFTQHTGPLATAHLFGVPMSARFIATAGGLGPHALVFVGLFAALAALAWWNARRAAMISRAAGSLGAAIDGTQAATIAAVMRVAPYTLLVSGAVLPLAAGIYLVTTTAWSAVENAALRRGLPPPEDQVRTLT